MDEGKEEEELRKLTNETEIWRYINRKRGKREWIVNYTRKGGKVTS